MSVSHCINFILIRFIIYDFLIAMIHVARLVSARCEALNIRPSRKFEEPSAVFGQGRFAETGHIVAVKPAGEGCDVANAALGIGVQVIEKHFFVPSNLRESGAVPVREPGHVEPIFERLRAFRAKHGEVRVEHVEELGVGRDRAGSRVDRIDV